ncbi:MAG: lysophospholipid acyltransferase family protein [Beijerinckiaceae bacterium]
MLKKILKSRKVLRGVGWAMGAYLKLVKRTTSFVIEPHDFDGYVDSLEPFIVTMWHGQHFMILFARRPQDKRAVMISRHGDGEINAVAAEAFGLRTIRGSGAQRRDQIRKRGGAEALRAGLGLLAEDYSLGVTADVPKVSRVAGRGIVVLAQLSGRPMVPVAVVTRRRIDFRNWDCSSIGLPFGKGAIVVGKPIFVERKATPADIETARIAVQSELDRVHARAYFLIGDRDPGADRQHVLEARVAAASKATET